MGTASISSIHSPPTLPCLSPFLPSSCRGLLAGPALSWPSHYLPTTLPPSQIHPLLSNPVLPQRGLPLRIRSNLLSMIAGALCELIPGSLTSHISPSLCSNDTKLTFRCLVCARHCAECFCLMYYMSFNAHGHQVGQSYISSSHRWV